ncbi:Zinc-finger homeodomain protein 1, partial [Cucurbita argyrosperma subsp. sororia]
MEFEDHDEEEDMEMEAPTNYDKPLLQTPPPPPPPLSRLNKTPSPLHSDPPPPPLYKECLKNHAVSIGGHSLDGCGEFMPAGPNGSLDALKCAACNCHRNFHRKDITTTNDDNGESPPFILSNPPPTAQFVPYWRAPAGYLHVAPQRRMLALPSPSSGDGGCRKRVRTKFTEEQKEKMLVMAEKLDWRIQKNDEAAVMEFCNEIGVKRRVLKVWMHNNKNTFRKDSEHNKFS